MPYTPHARLAFYIFLRERGWAVGRGRWGVEKRKNATKTERLRAHEGVRVLRCAGAGTFRFFGLATENLLNPDAP